MVRDEFSSIQFPRVLYTHEIRIPYSTWRIIPGRPPSLKLGHETAMNGRGTTNPKGGKRSSCFFFPRIRSSWDDPPSMVVWMG